MYVRVYQWLELFRLKGKGLQLACDTYCYDKVVTTHAIGTQATLATKCSL